ncbi:uncharacterized protein LOC133355767 isoform X1 [Lethenteron reissneri]|uniref:uncharacterized protein LOC133355767 isoform X1 n=2 Tax=Lethenteron reissneri TaxID=7753 RepID=UPI002AB6B048|nr:uncharacterized protein LOC133355767 isoform X1 [Lethenteron reissneri]
MSCGNGGGGGGRVRSVWDASQEVFLIEWFHDHRFMWDPSNPDYFKRDKRNRKMNELCEQLGGDAHGVPFTGEEIKFKWKNLRSIYFREVKKVEDADRMGSGRSNGYYPKWHHFERLGFLREAMQSRCGRYTFNQSALDKFVTDAPTPAAPSPNTPSSPARSPTELAASLQAMPSPCPPWASPSAQSMSGTSCLSDEDTKPLSCVRQLRNDGLVVGGGGSVGGGRDVIGDVGGLGGGAGGRGIGGGGGAGVGSVRAEQLLNTAMTHLGGSRRGTESADDIFGKYIAMSLREMPPRKRERARLALHKTLHDIAVSDD